MVVDFFSPWKVFNSPWAKRYHAYLIENLPEREALLAVEIPLEGLTKEKLYELSNGYTTPVVIRGGVKDTPAIKLWTDVNWWTEHYGNESVLCRHLDAARNDDTPPCTIQEAIGTKNESDRLYVAGDFKIFMRRPELLDMVESELLTKVSPGDAVFTQIFMGYPGMGSDIHSAIGCNMFRQIAGRKKWWLVPPSQTKYLIPSLGSDGFCADSLTLVGKGLDTQSPWMNKLERYMVTLEPGDMLLSTAWYWHGVVNLGEDPNELVIGAATRYSAKYSLPALRSNPLLSAIALAALQINYHGVKAFTSKAAQLQEDARRGKVFGGDGTASIHNVLV